MKIRLPKEKYYELAVANINIMDYTSNPFLAEKDFHTDSTMILDLDRLPYEYAKEVIKESAKYFSEKLKNLEKDLDILMQKPEEEKENYKVSYQIKDLERNIKECKEIFVSIELYVAMREGSLQQAPRTLRQMFYALKQFLDEELPKAKEGWIYRFDKDMNCYQPYLFTHISFYEARDKHEIDKIIIFSKYIKCNEVHSYNINITYDDMKRVKRNPKELLLSLGFFLEEEDWYNKYKETMEDYYIKAPMQDREFIDSFGTRYINDNAYNLSKSKTYKDTITSYFGKTENIKTIPMMPLIHLYNLKEHCFEYKDTRIIEPYKYDKNVEKKLILPKEHKNLIDILLSEEYQIEDSDIIKGKGNGTIILAMGGAGLGKTLTSEVYAERKGIPRLMVNASQLGTNETTIESKLQYYMRLAERWKCILLLDEADVMIRKRNDDIQHNAIVAIILQNIEYFNGILFMTTNRVDDVDEAIISRCSAVLKYVKPDAEMSRKLWEIFLEQNNLKEKVSDEVVEQILSNFEILAGRDIRNIISLVYKYAQGNKLKTIDFEVFKLCATFRGIYPIGGHDKIEDNGNKK